MLSTRLLQLLGNLKLLIHVAHRVLSARRDRQVARGVRRLLHGHYRVVIGFVFFFGHRLLRRGAHCRCLLHYR